mmetsp:Transcript_93976/g.186339  ORF Transcript_93976/g.186339 Transcript_93976/m.186339 type:complete len:313 (-) Transcript_93976:234-1172(-)
MGCGTSLAAAGKHPKHCAEQASTVSSPLALEEREKERETEDELGEKAATGLSPPALEVLDPKAREAFSQELENADWLGTLSLLEDAAHAVKADRECILATVQKNGVAVRFAADPLKADKEVVLAAVTQNGSALEYAADNMKADREVVLAAVAKDGASMKFATEDLKSDKNFVLTAISKSCMALEYAAASLKADEVVVAAATKNNTALHVPAGPLKADKEVVLTAVTQDAESLNDATGPLKADKEAAVTAVTQNDSAVNYIDATSPMWGDEEFVLSMAALRGGVLEIDQYADWCKADVQWNTPSTKFTFGVRS